MKSRAIEREGEIAHPNYLYIFYLWLVVNLCLPPHVPCKVRGRGSCPVQIGPYMTLRKLLISRIPTSVPMDSG